MNLKAYVYVLRSFPLFLNPQLQGIFENN